MTQAEQQAPDPRWARLLALRSEANQWWADEAKLRKNLDRNLQRDLDHGWLTPYLAEIDYLTWQRWFYWARAMMQWRLPDEPIPQIEFNCGGTQAEAGGSIGRSHLERCLDLIANEGRDSWQGWGSWTYMEYFLDWLLYGFGHSGNPQLPTEPNPGASMRLYQYFNLGILMAYPYDYWGGILAENRHGRHLGFYPTPHAVTEMMARMLFSPGQSALDQRLEKVCDCCLGTGRMLLSASNYSLSLHGQDVNETVIKASLVNGFLYAPWMVRPFPFLGDTAEPEESAEISDRMTEAGFAQGRPDVEAYLENTEHDSDEQWKFEPIKKRRKVKATQDQEAIEQGLLF